MHADSGDWSVTLANINLLHVIATLRIGGGAENVVTSLAMNLDKSTYNVTVCCLVEGDGRLADALRAQDLPVFVLGRCHKYDLRVLPDLIRLMRQQSIDIVHCHLDRAIVFGALAGKLAGVPIILSTEHGMLDQCSKSAILARRMISPLLSGITAISLAVKNSVIEHIGFDPDRVFPIYNGVKKIGSFSGTWAEQLRQTYGIESDCPLIGTACRMIPIKDPFTFVEAARLVLQKGIQVHFLMVGDGPLRESVENRITDLGLEAHFTLIQQTNDIYSVFSLLDVFILNSVQEGLGMVLLEAMLLGKPVVGTDTGGIKEIIVGERTGLLVPPRNPAALSDAMIRLIADPAMRKQMGEAGRQRVLNEFSEEKQAREMAALYETLMART